jgi:hypothetical protein
MGIMVCLAAAVKEDGTHTTAVETRFLRTREARELQSNRAQRADWFPSCSLSACSGGDRDRTRSFSFLLLFYRKQAATVTCVSLIKAQRHLWSEVARSLTSCFLPYGRTARCITLHTYPFPRVIHTHSPRSTIHILSSEMEKKYQEGTRAPKDRAWHSGLSRVRPVNVVCTMSGTKQ